MQTLKIPDPLKESRCSATTKVRGSVIVNHFPGKGKQNYLPGTFPDTSPPREHSYEGSSKTSVLKAAMLSLLHNSMHWQPERIIYGIQISKEANELHGKENKFVFVFKDSYHLMES